jgi:hypothetical protein
MSSHTKTITLIIGFIAVVGGIGWLLWFVFFAPALTPTPPAPDDQATATTSPDLPSAGPGTGSGSGTGTGGGTGNLPGTSATDSDNTSAGSATPSPSGPRTITATPLVDTAAQFPQQSGNNARFYDSTNGQFFTITADGRATPLTDQRFYNVEQVTWSTDGARAVLEYPDGANIVYNFVTGEQATLPAHWEEFSFSPAGTQIATKSIGTDRDSRWLITANSDGSGARLVEPLGDNADRAAISWSPNNLSIATFTEGISFDQQRLYFVGQNDENFKAATIEGRGFEHRWDPAGDRLLYSVYSAQNDLKPGLWVVDAKGETIGDNRRNLNIATWAHKCTVADTNTAYCAVPDTLPEGSGLFPELAASVPDSIYRINLTTGTAVLAARPDIAVSIDTLVVNETETDAYFTTSNQPGLYHLAL